MSDLDNLFYVPPDYRAVPRLAPQPPTPALTAAEALVKYLNDHEWDTSLRRKTVALNAGELK